MKKIIKNPLTILVVGLMILAASTAGATRAAFTYQTAAEKVNFSTANISVDILEEVEGEYVSVSENEGLVAASINEDDSIKPGKKYEEKLKVVNNSNEETGYSEYVRVVVRKSWFDESKNTSLDPQLIELEVADGWYINPDETTAEQTVYYLTSPLACGNEKDFLYSIKVKEEIATFVETKPVVKDGVEIAGSVENIYLYDKENLYLQIQMDAVQTHNCEDAIYAAWGVKATCDGPDDGNILSINGKAVQ